MLLVKFVAVLLLATVCAAHHRSFFGTQCNHEKYFVGSCDGDWHTAFAACALHGMELVVIDSSRKEREVEEAISVCSPQAGRNNGFWIGAYRVGEPGRWTWLTTGKETHFTKWGPGLPDNYGNERCVEIYKERTTRSFFWNDLPCDEEYVDKRYICQNKECECDD